MERLWAASIWSTLIFSTSLLLIMLTGAMYHWSGVQLETWLETSWPNPYRGSLFQKFRDQIMGVIPAQDPDQQVKYSHGQAYERQETQT
jgi:hypothetical protein